MRDDDRLLGKMNPALGQRFARPHAKTTPGQGAHELLPGSGIMFNHKCFRRATGGWNEGLHGEICTKESR
jgi:hypothetical protein